MKLKILWRDAAGAVVKEDVVHDTGHYSPVEVLLDTNPAAQRVLALLGVAADPTCPIKTVELSWIHEEASFDTPAARATQDERR